MSTLEDFLSLVNHQATQIMQLAQKGKELLEENTRLKDRIAALEDKEKQRGVL